MQEKLKNCLLEMNYRLLLHRNIVGLSIETNQFFEVFTNKFWPFEMEIHNRKQHLQLPNFFSKLTGCWENKNMKEKCNNRPNCVLWR